MCGQYNDEVKQKIHGKKRKNKIQKQYKTTFIQTAKKNIINLFGLLTTDTNVAAFNESGPSVVPPDTYE